MRGRISTRKSGITNKKPAEGCLRGLLIPVSRPGLLGYRSAAVGNVNFKPG